MLKIVVILEVLVLFNLLIGVHELGHFLAAKWRGLKIDRFAIWFGKPIWKKKLGGVEYALGWIPAGGYVALPQMATMELIEGKREETKVTTNYGASWWTKTEEVESKAGEASAEQLPPISALDKIIVAVAGPLFSFLLAVAFACVVWTAGKPVNENENSTTVGWVDPSGPAARAGLQPGDTVLAVDGHPVTKFFPPARDSITWRIITSGGDEIAVDYLRNGERHVARIKPYHRPTKWYERRSLRQILVGPEAPAIIYEVATNSPAAMAGLRPGDQIVAMDGQKIFSPNAIVTAEQSMSNSPVRPITLTVRRDREEFERTLLAEKPVQPKDSNPSLGIVAFQGETNVAIVHPTPLEQIEDSTGQIFATLGAVFSRNTDIGVQQLGGAVMIIRLYSNLFESEHGWQLVLWFSVVINVNLALLNLLPFPVLDGGHILLALIEVVRRRPVSAKVLQAIQTACAVALIAFMLFIAFFDTGDWIRSARADREQPVVFAAKPR